MAQNARRVCEKWKLLINCFGKRFDNEHEQFLGDFGIFRSERIQMLCYATNFLNRLRGTK